MLFNISKQHATEVIILCLCAIDMNSPQDTKQTKNSAVSTLLETLAKILTGIVRCDWIRGFLAVL